MFILAGIWILSFYLVFVACNNSLPERPRSVFWGVLVTFIWGLPGVLIWWVIQVEKDKKQQGGTK